MAKYLTVTQAQQQLPELPNELVEEPIVITQQGEPVMIAMSLEQFESLVETLEILSDREFMTEVREGIRQAEVGQTISLDDLKAELGF
jgi:antitoxin YefM